MLRKSHLKPLMLTLLASLTFLFACNKADLEDFDTTQTSAVDMPYIEGELLKDPVISDATEAEDMAIVNDGVVDGLDEDTYAFRTHSGRIAHLIDCLDSMQITQGQRDSIKFATRKFNQCRMTHIQAIRQIHFTIIKQANQARRALIQDYRNNVITYQQLQQALHQLNMQTRHAIQNHPGKQFHLQALQQCHQVYVNRMQTILGVQGWQDLKDCLRNP
jgi:uncharacterized protein YdeI (BOF family)